MIIKHNLGYLQFIDLENTVFSRLNAPGVYLKLCLRDPAFNRGPAFINEVKFSSFLWLIY